MQPAPQDIRPRAPALRFFGLPALGLCPPVTPNSSKAITAPQRGCGFQQRSVAGAEDASESAAAPQLMAALPEQAGSDGAGGHGLHASLVGRCSLPCQCPAPSQRLPALPHGLTPISRQHLLLQTPLPDLAPFPQLPCALPAPHPHSEHSAPCWMQPAGRGCWGGRGRVGGHCDNSRGCARASGADGTDERDEPDPPVLGTPGLQHEAGYPTPPPCALHPLSAGRASAPQHGPVVLPTGL